MEKHLLDKRLAIEYVVYFREYYILDKAPGKGMQQICFCPWCGTELPTGMSKKWWNKIEQMGIFDPFGDEKEKVPKEFWTDQWLTQN